MIIQLEKADDNGYQISDYEFEILQNKNANNKYVPSAEFGGLEVHNPQSLSGLYLSSDDYNRIYRNIVGKVLEVL